MNEPAWVRQDVVLAIHDRQLAEHGGMTGVRDEGLLSSALARPQHLFTFSSGQTDLAALAVAYAFGIARNHPFVDGNKRTAYVVCRAFLNLNGADFVATKAEKYRKFLQLAEGTITEEELAEWIRERLQPA